MPLFRIATLKADGTLKKKEQKRAIKDIITARNFVYNLVVSIKLLEPIDMLITKFQSDSIPISEVYQAFVKFLPQMFTDMVGVSQAEKAYVHKLITERFDFMLYGVAHGLGNILDPRYLGEGTDRVARSQVEDLLFAFGTGESS